MSRVEHPLIAINGLLVERPDPHLELSTRYADAVCKSGGVPVAIPPVGGPSDIDRLLDRVDGLLLAGGDDFDTERASMGVTSHGVYQTDGDPNNVTVYHHFDSMEAAKAFAGSPRLREVMEAAGVQGDPTIWFGTRV